MFITITTPSIARNAGFGRHVRHAVSLLAEIAVAILIGPIRFYQNRQLGETMARMSEHELSDIGLTRQDAIDTAALPTSSDAGTFLSARAVERRRSR